MADGCWGDQGLARENSVLRLEIQTLFRRLVSDADEASRSASIKLEDRECQTDADLAFEIPAVDKRISSVVKELSYQAALHGEHTRRSLELDTKISALDAKSLELELELISPNSKVLELVGVAEELQTQLDAASSGNSEVQREVDGLKETISLLTRSIHASDDGLVEKQQRFEATRQTISEKVKLLAESETQLSDAIILQEEYRVKLRVNAANLAGIGDRRNHCRRKSASQEREISALSEALRAARMVSHRHSEELARRKPEKPVSPQRPNTEACMCVDLSLWLPESRPVHMHQA